MDATLALAEFRSREWNSVSTEFRSKCPRWVEFHATNAGMALFFVFCCFFRSFLFSLPLQDYILFI
jgi:hypothetical protein